MKYLFSFKFADPQDPQFKEDILVLRILWFALGFITGLVLIFISGC
jgi:hypothetical protein